MGVPDDFSEQDLTSGMWWRHLVAVCLYLLGVCGYLSRAITIFYLGIITFTHLWYFETKYYCDSDKVPIIYHAHKDACTVKPGFKPVPPQLYFEFAALFWPS